MLSLSDVVIPASLRTVLRGIGQVFFQENAFTGACFALGIALSSPLMAVGAVVGAAIGTATAWLLKFDKAESSAGIYGFNSTLVGIATLFFFRPGVMSVGLLVVGCVVAALVTWLMRRYLPFPTYTTPFIVTTWAIFFLGHAMGVPRVVPGGATDVVGYFVAVAHGVSQVMFQAKHLDGDPLSRRHRPERLAARVVGPRRVDRRHAGRKLPFIRCRRSARPRKPL